MKIPYWHSWKYFQTGANYTVSNTTNNWSSGAIDISCAGSVTISMTAEGLGSMETADYLNIYNKVDGGSQVAISENSDSFTSKTVSANGISGNTLELIINGYTSYSDETYNVTNNSVVDPTKAAIPDLVTPLRNYSMLIKHI